MSFVFTSVEMPILHKNEGAELRRRLFLSVPGLIAMEELMEAATDLVFCIKNRHGQYLSANAAFLRRTRLANFDDLYGRTACEIFPGPLALGYEQQDSYVMASGKPIRSRLELVTNPNGSHGWYLADKVPVRDDHGEIVALAGISRDLRAAAADARLGPLAKAVERIRRDFASPLRIGTLAEEAGLSLSCFERNMRAVLHVSPRQLLTRIRVEAAAHALRTTDRSLVEIALDCGYCDQPTFCRQFKAEMGVTPRYHRQGAEKR
jgi:AraC-like DNA-binding protein